MTIGKKTKYFLETGVFVSTKVREHLTPGQCVRIAREKQGLSQNQLSQLTRLPRPTISGIESGRISLGIERAKVLARALKVHPAVLIFFDWQNKAT